MRGLDEPESFVNLFVLWKGSSSSFSGLVPDEGLMIPDILYLESALYIVNRFLCHKSLPGGAWAQKMIC